ERKPAQVDENVSDDLTRAVIRHLPAPVDLHDRDIAGREHVRAVRVQSEREDRRMLDEPDLVGGLGGAPLRECPHLVPDRLERPATEVADDDLGRGSGVSGRTASRGAHSTISISALDDSSRYSASTCSRLSARTTIVRLA